MTSQVHLNLETHLPPISRKEPRLWVKTFAVYQELKPDKLIRRIDLRRGLNIIWAKDSEAGASGHAAGKSTFCRLLRYLLGDSSYGSDDFRDALREKFPNACVAGEVHLDDEPWLVIRTLASHGKRQSARGATLDSLFRKETKFRDYQDFVVNLTEAFIAPLATNSFPGSGKSIEWKHLLHWMTRDQDARFAHLLEWRTSHQSHETKLSAADKINLIRLVLNLLDPDEIARQSLHSELQAKLKEIETLLPKLDYLKARTAQKLGESLNLKDGDLTFQYEALLKSTSEEQNKVSEAWNKANNHDGLDEFTRSALELAQQNVGNQQRNLASAEARLKRYRIDFQVETGQITEEERKVQVSQMGPAEGLCSTPLHLANDCPYAAPPDRDELQKARLAEAKSGAEKLEALIRTLEASIPALRTSLLNAQETTGRVAKKAAKQKEEHNETRKKLADKTNEISAKLTLLRDALDEIEESELVRTKQGDLRKKIEASSAKLNDFRKREEKQLSLISSYFSHVATALLNQPVEGHVRFTADEIRPSLEYAGDMSSAALVTLRLLIFDLACLVGSRHTLEHHPGFLVHDSPREADLSATIYRRIFNLIARPPENESVQYIIATTEPPPGELQSQPWLICDPLSSEDPQSRFLKRII